MLTTMSPITATVPEPTGAATPGLSASAGGEEGKSRGVSSSAGEGREVILAELEVQFP
jgi:hypothetical protein